MSLLPIETVLQDLDDHSPPAGREIGRSRADRPIVAHEFGRGPIRVSLIGGCHADEPVGPTMLRRLAGYLAACADDDTLCREFRWSIVPHVNPDGEERNRAWSDREIQTTDHTGAPDAAFDIVEYIRHVVRELPGDDIEFGFPRDVSDHAARVENRAVAAFLSNRGPFHLHGSFHGMGLAPGPWFLIEPSWIDQTTEMRRKLRGAVLAMGYPLFDVDRHGEKGFHRIDVGFCTRPDSVAMRDHFLDRGDRATAALFRPSSMEFVRGLGGDPLTLVSEMPLFLVSENPAGNDTVVFRAGTEGKRRLHLELERRVASLPVEMARDEIGLLGVRPMPIRDQMRLQLGFLDAALQVVRSQA